jgi:hypothetical protein
MGVLMRTTSLGQVCLCFVIVIGVEVYLYRIYRHMSVVCI